VSMSSSVSTQKSETRSGSSRPVHMAACKLHSCNIIDINNWPSWYLQFFPELSVTSNSDLQFSQIAYRRRFEVDLVPLALTRRISLAVSVAPGTRPHSSSKHWRRRSGCPASKAALRTSSGDVTPWQ
jgi:hypothetical protein